MLAILILIALGAVTFLVIPALVQIGMGLLFGIILKWAFYVAMGVTLFFLLRKGWRRLFKK